MFIRRFSLILAVLVLVAGFGIKNVLSSKKEPPLRNSLVREALRVQVARAENSDVAVSIPLTGRLTASRRVDLFAEVTGRLKSGGKAFREGVAYRKGEPILRLDDRDQRLGLVSQRAAFQSQLLRLLPDLQFDHADAAPAWSAYAEQLDPEKSLAALPETANESARNYLSVQGIFTQYYTIKAAEAQLAKFTVYAPFSGVITQGNLDPGTLVRGGVQVGQFLQPDRFEWEAAISPADLPYVRIGQSVSLTDSENGVSHTGRIMRISEAIDPGTQTVKIYVSLTADGLHEGQYLTGILGGESLPNAVSIPRALLREDGQIWILQDSALALHPVEQVFAFGDEVVVRGIPDGTQYITERLGGAFEGMPVQAASL